MSLHNYRLQSTHTCRPTQPIPQSIVYRCAKLDTLAPTQQHGLRINALPCHQVQSIVRRQVGICHVSLLICLIILKNNVVIASQLDNAAQACIACRPVYQPILGLILFFATCMHLWLLLCEMVKLSCAQNTKQTRISTHCPAAAKRNTHQPLLCKKMEKQAYRKREGNEGMEGKQTEGKIGGNARRGKTAEKRHIIRLRVRFKSKIGVRATRTLLQTNGRYKQLPTNDIALYNNGKENDYRVSQVLYFQYFYLMVWSKIRV